MREWVNFTKADLESQASALAGDRLSLKKSKFFGLTRQESKFAPQYMQRPFTQNLTAPDLHFKVGFGNYNIAYFTISDGVDCDPEKIFVTVDRDVEQVRA